ncbi:MAG: TrkH family potassium uptake protein [Parvibaculales bacterium]
MQDFRPVFFIIGVLLAALAASMLVPAGLDFVSGDDNWKSFVAAAAMTGFFAGVLVLTNRGDVTVLNVQQAFALTSWSWISLTGFAALPFCLGGLDLSYTDGFFEAMSGLSTTGATVIGDLSGTSKGVLLWRALLQWFGGIGIIVMAIAVLPLLNVGGMQLFRIESSDNSEKILPRATEIAGSIARIYLGITLACAVGYLLAGMSGFDAIAHAMTTIATGGFSTMDNSFAAFDSAAIDWVAILFMIASSLPFAIYLQAVHSNRLPLFQDAQVRTFAALLLGLVATIWGYRLFSTDIGALHALREVFFNVTSVLTGTGYVTSDFDQWGTLPLSLFFLMAFIGGCAGSTACGLKVFRFQLILKAGIRAIRQLVHPNGIFALRYNGRPVNEEVAESVLTFAITYFIIFILVACALGVYGIDVMTALSASASTISNLGPGLGDIIGPSGNYAGLPDGAKWVLCLAMLLGRLELFTLLVMLTPAFWRR